MSTIEISIRSIQHYLYCPHRWGLLEIDKAWSENIFVTKANLMHDRVHQVNQGYVTKTKKRFTAVPVYHDLEAYNLYGIVDCIEMIPQKNGIMLPGEEGNYQLQIVEYKPTKPKDKLYNEEDLMQVFAQKLCVDFIFGGCAEGILYYANEKKRVKLPLVENYMVYDKRLKSILAEMRHYLEQGSVPSIDSKQNCSGCSMKDLCMPFAKKSFSLKKQIKRIGEQGS